MIFAALVDSIKLMDQPLEGPKILYLDIETSPILANIWKLFEENISVKQIWKDWFVLSWAAKWDGSDEIFYQDQRTAPDIEDDSAILAGIWRLIDEADIVVGQNSKRFDIKKLNTRFIIQKMHEPSNFTHIDTLQIARSKFAFTSNKLEYLISVLCPHLKKYEHKKFPGIDLWLQCIFSRTPEAWDELEIYNKADVIGLEAVYKVLEPWATGANSYNPDVYHSGLRNVCKCGSIEWQENGYAYYSHGKYKRFRCKQCRAPRMSKINELTKEKLRSFLK